MSLEIRVYAKEFSDDLIPRIVGRLNDFEMDCEIYPKFSFGSHAGFLPFRFRLANPPFDALRDKDLLTGFELRIDEFDLEQEKGKAAPERTFFGKLFGSGKSDRPFAGEEIDKRLAACKERASFVWHLTDSFELRFAYLTSAILADLTGGVCSYPADNLWYENKNIVENAWHEIRDHETNHLKEHDLKFHEFGDWDK